MIYKGRHVVKINDNMVRDGNKLIAVRPEELTIPTVSGICESCGHPASTLGYDYFFTYRVIKACGICYEMFCVPADQTREPKDLGGLNEPQGTSEVHDPM